MVLIRVSLMVADFEDFPLVAVILLLFGHVAIIVMS